MKKYFVLVISLLFIFGKSGHSQDIPAQTYTGQWTLDIEGGFVGWLKVTEADGYLDGSLLWKWGSVTPVSHVYFDADANQLVVTRTQNVVRKRDEAGQPVQSHTVTSLLVCKIEGDIISGVFTEPDRSGLKVVKTAFTGRRLPPVPVAPDLSRIKYGQPITLFNGRDLTGWKLTSPNQANGFKAENGVLVNDPVQPETGPRLSFGNLRTEQVFEDFNLSLEVNVPKGSNSGVYLRGIYEIQVLDSYGKELDSHNMGGIYSRTAPTVAAEKPAGQWQTLDMTLVDRHITIKLNGTTIIDNQPVEGPTGGALHSDVFAPGPIYLQGDHGKVSFRNIVLKPIIK
jgi:hypothetical protein